MPGTALGEVSPIPVLKTLLGKGSMAPSSEARPIGQDREPRGEITTIIKSPGPDVDS
jgi:hypothetical protein